MDVILIFILSSHEPALKQFANMKPKRKQDKKGSETTQKYKM